MMLLPYHVDLEQQRRRWMLYALMGLNLVAFIPVLLLSGTDLELFYYKHGYVPERGSLVTIFSSMFLHGGWLHLIGNLYFLWMFGRAVEEKVGGPLFLVFYLAAGCLAALCHQALTPEVVADAPAVGASGAISGVLGAFLVLFPAAEVSCVFFFWGLRPTKLVRLRAYFVLGFWFALQIIMGFSLPSQTVGVAYGAHLGGFLFGALLFGCKAGAVAARREWKDLVQRARYRRAAARIAAGKLPPAESAEDPVLARMVFLENGLLPESGPAAVEEWTKPLDTNEDTALLASLALRSASSGIMSRIGPAPGYRLARALAKIGLASPATEVLIWLIPKADRPSQQRLYYEIGDNLMKVPERAQIGAACLQAAHSLDPKSKWGQSAEFLLQQLGGGER